MLVVKMKRKMNIGTTIIPMLCNYSDNSLHISTENTCFNKSNSKIREARNLDFLSAVDRRYRDPPLPIDR